MSLGAPPRGFTLVELLVVIVLISTIVGVALPAFGSFLSAETVDSAGGRLRAAQRRAVQSGAPVRIEVDGRSILFLPDSRAVGAGAEPLTGRLLADGS